MNNDLPTFAVVGHPNKGKSSIVAALTHTDTISISALSGTTTQSQAFSFFIAGQPLYHLVDTPGFQRPRQLLELIEAQAKNASERLLAIERFIANYHHQLTPDAKLGVKSSSRFKDEVELLTPILAGAGIIYVVDGSVPYSPEYEAEMTILQWTGQPRMALINPIGGEQYVAQWQAALGQFFSIVRVFNPMTASIEKQCSVLSAFAQLDFNLQEPLEKAQHLIRSQSNLHRTQAANVITQYLADVLHLSMSMPIPHGNLKSSLSSQLKKRYKNALELREENMQKVVAELYSHLNLQSNKPALDFEFPDVFDQSHWYLFGLTRKKLVTLSASTGAAAGAVIDVGLGGASLMAGALFGGLTGGAASFYFSGAPEKVRLKNIPLGGLQLLAGPIRNLQFCFVLLGRAVSFHRAVCHRSHANRALLEPNYESDEHWLNQLEKSQQLHMTRLLQKAYKGLNNADLSKLQSIIEQLLLSVESGD